MSVRINHTGNPSTFVRHILFNNLEYFAYCRCDMPGVRSCFLFPEYIIAINPKVFCLRPSVWRADFVSYKPFMVACSVYDVPIFHFDFIHILSFLVNMSDYGFSVSS